MKTFDKSSKLDNVLYDVRGPVVDEAARMEADGLSILKLNIGNPAPFGFNAPEEVILDMRQSLWECQGYSDSKGLFSARKAIMQYCQLKKIPGVTMDDIYTGNGVSELINLSMQALLNDGDEILIPAPDYPLWTATATLAGGKVVHYICDEESDWNPDIADIRSKITDKTKAIVIINPNNPTGAVMTREDLEAIAEVIIRHDIYVLSDEIYSELTYAGDHVSIASLPGMKERTITMNGFSKAYAMTGWRLGFVCGPQIIMDQMLKIHQYAIMCAPTNSQYAAVEALRNCGDEVKKMRDAYNQRRRFLMSEFKRMGIECFEPYGAFYVFPCIKSTGMTSDEFCEKLLLQEKVLAVPGNAFGDCGEGFLRISYAYSLEDLKEALGRLEHFVNRLRAEKK